MFILNFNSCGFAALAVLDLDCQTFGLGLILDCFQDVLLFYLRFLCVCVCAGAGGCVCVCVYINDLFFYFQCLCGGETALYAYASRQTASHQDRSAVHQQSQVKIHDQVSAIPDILNKYRVMFDGTTFIRAGYW